jgi:hypothetical protein
VSDHYWLWGWRIEYARKNQREIYDMYLGKLEELKKRGLLKDMDLRVLNFSIFGMINSFARWYKDGGHLSSEGDNLFCCTFGLSRHKPVKVC